MSENRFLHSRKIFAFVCMILLTVAIPFLAAHIMHSYFKSGMYIAAGILSVCFLGNLFLFQRVIRPAGTDAKDASDQLAPASDLRVQNTHEVDEMKRIQKKLEEIVHQRTIQLKRLNDHLIYSEEDERKAIASDLHDSVTQTLAMSISKLKNIKESGVNIPPESLDEIQGYLEQAVREIRSLIYQLSPPVLDDFDIDIALGFLIEQVNLQHQSDFVYTNHVAQPVPLPQALKITIYRAVSELITNILKHSGVKKGQIFIGVESGILMITVEDSGKGFDPSAIKNFEAMGFGLNSLSERIENFHGQIYIESSIGMGTKIILTVPVFPSEIK